MSATPIEVKAQLRALRCAKKKAAELLSNMSMGLLDTLQQHLIVNSEKRTKDRLLCSMDSPLAHPDVQDHDRDHGEGERDDRLFPVRRE